MPIGPLKAQMNVEGLFSICDFAAELGVPTKKTGKLVVSLDNAGEKCGTSSPPRTEYGIYLGMFRGYFMPLETWEEPRVHQLLLN